MNLDIRNIVVIGASGQVARSLNALNRSSNFNIACYGRQMFDLSGPHNFAARLKDLKPEAVINAAAYTAVDAAENDIEAAYHLNERGPSLLAQSCSDIDIPFLHISTDYVFDGSKSGEYKEGDQTGPTGVYGASKRAGEVAVLSANPQAMVFRTAWVYSPYGKNFLKTMLALADSRDELSIVADQFGNPTYAPDIADSLLSVLSYIAMHGWDKNFAGIFHMVAVGRTSWHGFADYIFDESTQYGANRPKLNAITTSDYPTPAKRPENSALDCTKLKDTFKITLPNWQTSTQKCLKALYENKAIR